MRNKQLFSVVLASSMGLLQIGALAQGDRHGEGQGGREGDRGAGPESSFYRGGRLPDNYRSHRYVVEDWHGHGLRAPPRGYHWVQTGGDYVLVAVATGVILDLMLNH